MNMPAKPDDFNDLVSETLKTTSRIIAEKFEKEHKVVLRAIRDLIAKNEEWGVHNFAPFKNNDLTGESTSHYEMTRDGYSMLVMGFTGRKAMDWKIRFLSAFNAMEERLRLQGQAATIDLSDPAQLVPLLTSYAQRTQVAEAKVTEMSPKAEAFDRLDVAEGNLTVRPASKVLGYPERKLTRWMELNHWAFRQNGRGPLQAYVEKRNAGYLDHRLRHFDDPKTGEPKVEVTLTITPKGLSRLARLLPKEGGEA